MRVIKCTNGHFFDGERFDRCPHCGAPAVMEPQASFQKTCPKCGAKTDDEAALFCIECGSRLPESSSEEWFPNSSPEPDLSFTPEQPAEEPLDISPEPANKEEIDEELRAAISEAAGDSGKTIGFFGRPGIAGSASEGSSESDEPVAGWLVCIRGPYTGKCFSIYSGRNTIGRLSSNRIVLSADQKVSRNAHAIVIYEPKKRVFLVQPGEGSGLTYLNDDMLLEVKELKESDRIEIGDGLFFLLPLCGPDFSWEEYIQ